MSYPILTPYQTIERLIENDKRNVSGLLRPGSSPASNWQAQIIADCAARLFQAREVDSTMGGNELERKAERNLREALDAAEVYAAPPWLSDVAEALGMVRPCDGAPLALNWTQVLAEIRDQRDELIESKLDLKRLLGDDGKIESVIKERDAGRLKISALLDAAERLLEHFSDGLPEHMIEEFKDAVVAAKKPGWRLQ